MLPSRQLERKLSEMDQQIDLRVAELMASRLCHDLVGPIGAVNNGLELMEPNSPQGGPGRKWCEG